MRGSGQVKGVPGGGPRETGPGLDWEGRVAPGLRAGFGAALFFHSLLGWAGLGWLGLLVFAADSVCVRKS